MHVSYTFVAWLKLGEFLLCSVGPISESGREIALALVGEPFGVLFMRSGETFATLMSMQFFGASND
jgi:hypothetical protein